MGRKKYIQKYVWFFFSCCFYVLMLATLHNDVANGSALHQPDEVKTLFYQLEHLTIIVWSFYPIAVLLGRAHAGLISAPAEDMLLCALDMVAKLGMEVLIFFHLMHSSDIVSTNSSAGSGSAGSSSH